MEVTKISGATRNLGAPANWDHSRVECEVLPIRDQPTETGNVMVSAWRPEPEELAALNSGGAVLLYVYGSVHPVVAMAVSVPEEQRT